MAESPAPANPAESAEEAMRRACELILKGDFFAALADLTPEAMTDAMALGAGLTGLPLPDSYELEPAQQDGEDTRYFVTFKAGDREMRARADWRRVEGVWKIAGMGIEHMT